jgi:hypothetical protein
MGEIFIELMKSPVASLVLLVFLIYLAWQQKKDNQARINDLNGVRKVLSGQIEDEKKTTDALVKFTYEQLLEKEERKRLSDSLTK